MIVRTIKKVIVGVAGILEGRKRYGLFRVRSITKGDVGEEVDGSWS